MKIFFNAPFRGKKIHQKYYEEIYNTIEKLGYVLLDKSLLSDSINKHYQKIEESGQKSFGEFYEYTMQLLKTADINVFECSFPSLGLGYQIDKSLDLNKPTIILYLKNQLPHFLIGIQNEKLVLALVNDKKNLKKTLEKAFEEARQRADKRFNFFISPRLLNYLEKISKDEGITKSKFIRNLILDHMKRTS